MNGIEIFLSVFSSSFIGAMAKDLHDAINDKKSNFRVLSIIVSSVTSFFIVAFGVHSFLPDANWRFLSFLSFVLSFSSIKIASIFSKNLFIFSSLPILKDLAKSIKEEESDDRSKKEP
jgi:hypothetical protein